MEWTDKVFKLQGMREEDSVYLIYSPADRRTIPFDKRWTFNGDYKAPTFSPSMLERPVHGKKTHFFLREGMIQYLTDSQNDSTGETVECPMLNDWPQEERDTWLYNEPMD